MSLKAFHIIFILFATAFCLGFTAWAFTGAGEMESEMKIPGIVTAVMGVFVLSYGVWFVKKKASTIIVQ